MATDEILYVDVHESQKRIELARKKFRGEVEVKPLPTGDFACGDIAFEYKGDDFVNSCYKRLLFQQMEELKEVYPRSFLMVGKNFNNIAYRFKHRNMAVGAMSSLILRGTPPIFMTNEKLAMDVMVNTFHKMLDGGPSDVDTMHRVRLNPRKVAEDDDWQVHVLSGFPKLGKQKARAILKEFGSLKNFINATPKEMADIKGVKSMAQKWYDIINSDYEGDDEDE